VVSIENKKVLLQFLADGKFHSGESIAKMLGVSRTAIWKQVQTLSDYGIEIYSVRGKGYKLSRPIELLDISKIRSTFTQALLPLIKDIEIFFETESTNQYLLELLSSKSLHGRIALAEFQISGRGRRGRSWISPIGSGVCLSVGWCFDSQPESIMALSLAAGVAVAHALEKVSSERVCLKWPNDIVYDGKKLGGILLESRGESAGPCAVVIGIGINVNLPGHINALIDQAHTDLARINATPPSRNLLAGSIISEILKMLVQFEKQGFSAFF